jgi:hypothetical protein
MEPLVLKYNLEKYLLWRKGDIDLEELLVSVLFDEKHTDGNSNEEKLHSLLLRHSIFQEGISKISHLSLENATINEMSGRLSLTYNVTQWWEHEERETYELESQTFDFKIISMLKSVEFKIAQ